MAIERKKYCVNGEWKDSKTDKWMEVTDSSTGEVIAEVPCCTEDEVEEAIAAAHAAFPEWSMLSLSKRTQMMFKWRDVLVAHLDELTELCAKELGKNLVEARGDILKAIEPTELACSAPFITQGSASLQVTTGFDTATYRMPLGVIAGIVPFNFPAMIPWGWMVPLAIATGNTVVLKAASYTPLTSMRILELFYEEAGFPKGIVNLVTCSRKESELFLTDPRIKAVTFVGSTDIGKHIYSVAAAHGKRVQAQTEAKNHALVLDDCEIFGPVTVIKRVKTFEERLAIMNANRFANGSAIFTQNGYYARQFELLSDGGMVGINVGIPVPSAYFPFSGNKDSFFGDQHVLGLDGVRFYTRAKTVTKHWYDEHSRKKTMDTWEGTVERL